MTNKIYEFEIRFQIEAEDQKKAETLFQKLLDSGYWTQQIMCGKYWWLTELDEDLKDGNCYTKKD